MRLKTKKNALLLILCLIIIVTYKLFDSECIFEKVDRLSKDVVFVGTVDFESLIVLRLGEPEIADIQMTESLNVGYSEDRARAILPCYSTLYTCSDETRLISVFGTKVTLFDLKGNLVGQLDVLEQDSMLAKNGVLGRCSVEDRKLFVLYTYIESREIEEGDAGKVTLKSVQVQKNVLLSIDLETFEIEKVVDDILNWKVFSVADELYVCDDFDKCYIYDLTEKEIKERDWSGSYFDCEATGGVLVSTVYNMEEEDVTLVKSDGVKVILPWGCQGQWGADGKVYFVRGRIELWRCNADGSQLEKVFEGPGRKRYNGYVTGSELVFDRSRTILAFCYRVDYCEMSVIKPPTGLVVIDLENEEYMHIRPDECIEMFYDVMLKSDTFSPTISVHNSGKYGVDKLENLKGRDFEINDIWNMWYFSDMELISDR